MLVLVSAVTLTCALVSSARAAPPQHLPLGVELSGLNHPCGVAVDSNGSLYVASAGEDTIRIFDAERNPTATIAESTNEPCGLAVDSRGDLYVSERGVHEVVRYRRTEAGFAPRQVVDPSGEAEGIAVDPHDDRLYVAEGDHVQSFSGVDERQRVAISGTVTSGTYTLTFKGTVASPLAVPQTTAPLPYNASAAEIKAALEGLAAIGPGDVEVQEVTGFSGPVNDVTFTGAYERKDIEALEIDGSGLVGGGGFVQTKVDAWEGAIEAEGQLTDISGVAAYTNLVSKTKTSGGEIISEESDHYLFVADRSSEEVKILLGRDPFGEALGERLAGMKVIRTISGPRPGEDFEFGTAGTYLAVDGGNADEAGKCVSVKEQACTAGHLLVYDAGHDVVDEFEASGEFLDSFSDPGLEDAAPTALAIERSGGPNDGNIYVTSGAGTGGSVLAFAPLAAPSRRPLPTLSRKLAGASAVATDPRGYVYVRAGGGRIHVFSPTGEEIEVGGLDDPNNPTSLAVDSSGHVYVVDVFGTAASEPPVVTYYTPSAYPPVDGTAYVRHEPPIVELTTPGFEARANDVAVDPTNDRVFVLGRKLEAFSSVVGEFGSVEEGSNFVRLTAGSFGSEPTAMSIYGAKSDVYASTSVVGRIEVVYDDPLDPPALELARIGERGCPSAVVSAASKIAVDQSNGHVLVFSPSMAAGREYDASGACVTEFFFPEPQRFATTGLTFDIAVDSSCAVHRNAEGDLEPLDETTTPTCAEFDPANGNTYIAYDDPKATSPDLWAFGPLSYGALPEAITGLASAVGAGAATLNGNLNPHEFEVEECFFEWGTSEAYGNLAPCTESSEAIGSGTDAVAVHAEIAGIDPQSTRYHFRLCAVNKFGEKCGEDAVFGPPVVSDQSALPVLYDEATLRAQVDPAGLVTKYHFDYLDAQSFEEQGGFEGPATLHTADATLAAGAGPSAVKVAVSGLAEGTTYRFRVVAENEAASDAGPADEFTTLTRRSATSCPNEEYRTGASAALPDCRAYELVTPAETGGLTPVAAGTNSPGTDFDSWLVLPRGEGAGQVLTYFTRGTLAGFEGNGTLDAYRAERASGEHPLAGWSSQLAGPTYAEAVPDLSHNIDVRGVSSDQLFSFWALDPALSLPGGLPAGSYLSTPAGLEPVGLGTATDHAATSRYVGPGGQHVIFSSAAQLAPGAPPPGTVAIYDRPAGSSATQLLSVPPLGATQATQEEFEEEDATFLGASEDGTAVVFSLGGVLYLASGGQSTEVAPTYTAFDAISTDGQRLLYTAAGDIFAYEAGTTVPIATEASFAAASADGSHVFFAATEGGTRNLYVSDGTATSLIAALSPSDPPDISPRVTPAGDVLLFRSRAQLSAYDNEGKAEIYRYAPAAAGEELLCVSCDPSRAPPSGDAALRGSGEGFEVSSSVLIPNLTDNGERVLFESPDRLLPEDANDLADVYEWTAREGPGCSLGGGCLALISSGQGEGESHLFGMSADGRDVIFFTLEKLLERDVRGSPSLYDAREGGGIPEELAARICTGDACQGAGSPLPTLPQPTTTGSGGGNAEQGRKRPCPKGKRRVRRHGKALCVKRHPRKRHRRRGGQGQGRRG